MEFERLPDCERGSYITAYSVVVDGQSIGRAYKKRGFSYRGTQGWNRGVRLQDYHPIEWAYQLPDQIGGTDWAASRKSAAQQLLQIHRKRSAGK